jgi:L-iditol 2-dehydrogenase
VHKLPEGLSMAAGSLSEPLAVSVHAVIEQSPPLAGEVVVVIGPGAIGLLCAQVARAVGATVVLVGRSRHADRLELARRLGVDRTVDSETEDVEAVVKSLTDGYGAHSVFECSGAAGILESVPPLLRKGGRIVLVAFFHTPPAVDVDKLINNELELVGSRGKRASSFQTALRLKGIDLVSQGVKVVLEVRPD